MVREKESQQKKNARTLQVRQKERVQLVKAAEACAAEDNAAGKIAYGENFGMSACDTSVTDTHGLPDKKADQDVLEGEAKASLSSEKYWQKPDWILNYEVLERLGAGSLTTVYKVRRHGIDEVFVAKVLRKEFAENPRTAKRFIQEAQKAMDLTSAHLVSVYESGRTAGGQPFLICDCIDCGNLAERLAQFGRLAQVEVLDLMLQVCDGLNHAHKKGVIHRDIKPGNIVFKQGAAAQLAKLADLGIAKVLPGAGRETQYFTPLGEAFGNPSYMSPEQINGRRLDGRADIYALGCVMYECLCGRPPFVAENCVQVAIMQLGDEAQSLCSQDENLKISPGADAIVMRMIEKNPDNRYQTVDELLDDLKLVRAGGQPKPAPPRVVAQPEVDQGADQGQSAIYPVDRHEEEFGRPSMHFDRELARHALEQSPKRLIPLPEFKPQAAPEGDAWLRPLDWLFENWMDIIATRLLEIHKAISETFADKPFVYKIVSASVVLSFVSLICIQTAQVELSHSKAHHPPGFFNSLDRLGKTVPLSNQKPRYYAHTAPPLSGWLGNLFAADETCIKARNGRVLFYCSSKYFPEALQEAVLHGEDLSGADFEHQNMSGLYLPCARLHGAIVNQCDMSSCNLVGADLSEAKVTGSLLVNCDLRRANLRAASIQGTMIAGSNLKNCDLTNLEIPSSLITNEMLAGVARTYEPQVDRQEDRPVWPFPN